MPSYEYRCSHCAGGTTLRRLFAEMDAPAESVCCGAPLRRQFTPNGNIQIPIHFRQFLEGGAPGGGGLSWSDFHGETERELAHMNVEPTNRARSAAGR